jgi:hypothetical protein
VVKRLCKRDECKKEGWHSTSPLFIALPFFKLKLLDNLLWRFAIPSDRLINGISQFIRELLIEIAALDVSMGMGSVISSRYGYILL